MSGITPSRGELASPHPECLAAVPAQETLSTSPGGSLRTNFSWMLIGNAVYAVCQWGILGVFARLGTPAMVGQLVLALAVTAPVMAFFLLQLRSVQATDARQDFQFGHYFALRLLALAAAFLTIGLICAGAGYQGETQWMILAVALSASADGISDTAYGLLQRHERLEKIAHSLMLRGSLGLAAIGLTMFFTRQQVLAILAGAAARFVIVAGFDLRNVRRVLGQAPGGWRPRWERTSLLSLAKLAAPLGLVMMLIGLNNSLPRYFVERHFDQASLGIFGAIGYLSVVGSMVVGALGESITPRLARAIARNDKSEFFVLSVKLAGLGAGIGAVGVAISWAAGPMILTLLYGPEYAEHDDLLVWVLLAAAVGYAASFSGYAITAARFFRSQIPLFIAVTLTNALACNWLVPWLGLRGAALSLLTAACVQLLGTWLILWYGLSAEPMAHGASLDRVPETA